MHCEALEGMRLSTSFPNKMRILSGEKAEGSVVTISGRMQGDSNSCCCVY